MKSSFNWVESTKGGSSLHRQPAARKSYYNEALRRLTTFKSHKGPLTCQKPTPSANCSWSLASNVLEIYISRLRRKIRYARKLDSQIDSFAWRQLKVKTNEITLRLPILHWDGCNICVMFLTVINIVSFGKQWQSSLQRVIETYWQCPNSLCCKDYRAKDHWRALT